MLTIETKPDTKYCVPLFVRDEQIKLATARITDRVVPYDGTRLEPCAIVGSGPSLQETWEGLKAFPYIFTASGSHKFLIERGIVPSHHCEVDPRAHKVGLMGPPHPAVQYLIASTCCPQLFDHLDGYQVKLWHIFDSADESIRVLPPGEWAVTGGIDAGLRAMTLARFLGFTDLHFFGMDASSPEQGSRHAHPHPHTAMRLEPVTYEGRTFLTTPGMLAAAQGIWHELNQLIDVNPVFHGDGLIQHMAKFWVRAETTQKHPIIAFRKPELISAEYQGLNTQLHRSNVAYGVGGGKYAPIVLKLVEALKPSCNPFPTVCDYGSGKGYLAKALPFPIVEYDPCVPGKQESPKPCDVLISTDVLEHIERDKLLLVLADMQRCCRKVAYLVIHTQASSKVLPDGRNTHLIQEGKSFWVQKLSKFFVVGSCKQVGPLLHIVAAPKVAKGKG